MASVTYLNSTFDSTDSLTTGSISFQPGDCVVAAMTVNPGASGGKSSIYIKAADSPTGVKEEFTKVATVGFASGSSEYNCHVFFPWFTYNGNVSSDFITAGIEVQSTVFYRVRPTSGYELSKSYTVSYSSYINNINLSLGTVETGKIIVCTGAYYTDYANQTFSQDVDAFGGGWSTANLVTYVDKLYGIFGQYKIPTSTTSQTWNTGVNYNPSYHAASGIVFSEDIIQGSWGITA